MVNDDTKLRELREILDLGEASAIALALEIEDCLLLIDGKSGRKVAIRLGLSVAGTLRIILQAKQADILLSVSTVLAELQANGFRFDEAVKQEILRLADE